MFNCSLEFNDENEEREKKKEKTLHCLLTVLVYTKVLGWLVEMKPFKTEGYKLFFELNLLLSKYYLEGGAYFY